MKSKTKALSGLAALGDRVRDRVTGFTGIVMGEYLYTTGCRQLGVAPEKLTKDGGTAEWASFDETRLEVLARGVHPVTVHGKLEAMPGGPMPTPKQSRPVR